jgi:hypothetical protein
MLLAFAAFAAFAGSFVTTPIVARGAAGSHPMNTPVVRALPAPSIAGVVLPRRDPFTGDPSRAVAATPLASVPNAASTSVASPAMPVFSAIPPALRPLPPNDGVASAAPPFGRPPSALPALIATTARVTAVVTGARPFALVDEAGTTRLVTVGDRIAGETIAAITADGIRLARGAVLAVAPVSSPNRSDSGGR